MTTLHESTPVTSVRAALRLGRAVTAFVSASDGQFELRSFHVDELRVAMARLLAVLDAPDGDEGRAPGVDAAVGGEIALRALDRVDWHRLDRDVRARLAAGVAHVHAQLLEGRDDDVTRGLLDGTPVGPSLAQLVFGCDPARLTPDAQVSYCQAAQRLESAAHARLGAGLVAFAGSSPRQTRHWIEGEDIELTDVRASEIASALSWSGNRARDSLAVARTMDQDLDLTSTEADAGALQPAAVTAISDGVQLLTAGIDGAIADARDALAAGGDSAPDVSDRLWDLTQAREALVQQYDTAVSRFAATHTVAETRRKVRDTLARLDPSGFEARRAKAREAESGVEFRALPHAMAMVTAVMPSEHAAACFSAIDGAARDASRHDQQQPLGVRRSEALYRFCVQPLPAATADPAGDPSPSVGRADAEALSAPVDPPGQRRSMQAHVDIVMTLDALLGLTETPADCVGAGPIPASDARRLLAESALVTFRRVIIDGDTGHVIETGTKRYRLSEAERSFILLRDRTCRHPGCNQPARRCEVDHAVPYDAGGATRADNLGALCTRHHLEKTHAGWAIEDGAADGSCTFVSPLGRRYPHEPQAVLPWLSSEGSPPDDPVSG